MKVRKDTALAEQLESAVLSGQACIIVRSYDYDDVLATLFALSKAYGNWNIRRWDRARGLEEEIPKEKKTGLEKGNPNSAIAVVQALFMLATERKKIWAAVDGDPDRIDEVYKTEELLVLHNGHREVVNNSQVNADMVTRLMLTASAAKAYGCHVIITAPPGAELPEELKELFWVIDHELPSSEERQDIIEGTVETSGFDKLEPAKMESVVKVTGGLTRQQVEGVCAQSLARYQEIREKFVWSLKANTINKSGTLSLHRGDERFASYVKKTKNGELMVPGLGGLQGVKDFCLRLLEEVDDPDVIAKPKGILLLGVPGTGKSQFCKCLGNETKRPTLTLDVGTLMGGLVGQTEERTREALRIADAMAPCVLFVDEVEKALGGSGGEHDGGVNARLKGTLLRWMNDHESDVFFIATANDISMLPPEMTRSERFDATFFMDLPGRDQKDVIWDIYLKTYRLDPNAERPDDKVWTGAEIKSCCKLANRLRWPLMRVSDYVIPVYQTWRDKLFALREWATHRCVDAESGKVYVRKEKPVMSTAEDSAPGERRRVTRRTK